MQMKDLRPSYRGFDGYGIFCVLVQEKDLKTTGIRIL